MTHPRKLALAADDALISAREGLRAEFSWQGPVAVSLCDLVPHSGIDLLVQVAAMLRYAYPHLRWVVMGDGALLAPLQRLAAGLGVADRISFAGRLPDDEAIQRLVAADLFMQPTRPPEGSGWLAVEAAACGLPVVATPVGTQVEAVRSLPYGRLSDGLAPAALAQAVAGLLRDMETGDAAAMRRDQRAAADTEARGPQ